MSIELLIALIGLVTAIVGLLAALTPYLGGLSMFVQEIIKRIFGGISSRKPKTQKPKTPSRLPESQNWFVNVGEHKGHVRWEDCIRYGCISAGGGPQFTRALQRLSPGDTVYAYINRFGYVGGGKVLKTAVPVHEFITEPRNTPLPKRDLVTSGINNQPNNLDFTDWVAGIEWFKTFEREQASKATEHYRGTVCEIQDSDRLASLRKTFGT
ncbi:MAG: hypothetical protein WBB01_19595 [Phormidesmis sp.]